jgi:hypothetical protein
MDLNKYDTLRFKDLKKVGNIHELLEQLICNKEIPEDIIEYMLKPIEDVLTHNGVNLQETDY